MDCGRIWDQLSLYIDGMLDERSLQAVEKHLAECADCRAELASLKALVGAAQEIQAVEPPSGLRTRIAAATTGARDTAAVRTGFFPRLREMLSPRAVAWAGGLACAVAAISIFAGFQHPSKPGSQVAARTHAPAPVAAKVHAMPSATSRVSLAMIPSLPQQKAASVAPIRRHRTTVRTGTAPRMVAFVPKTTTTGRAKAVAQPRPNGSSPTDAAADIAEIDDTTSATTVSYNPSQQPAPEITNTSTNKRPGPIKVAASLLPKQEDTEKWLREVKTRASMRSSDRGPNVMCVINARF